MGLPILGAARAADCPYGVNRLINGPATREQGYITCGDAKRGPSITGSVRRREWLKIWGRPHSTLGLGFISTFGFSELFIGDRQQRQYRETDQGGGDFGGQNSA